MKSEMKEEENNIAKQQVPFCKTISNPYDFHLNKETHQVFSFLSDDKWYCD